MSPVRRVLAGRSLAAAAMATAVLATFSEALLTSHVFYQRDILSYWYPHMFAFRRAVAEGSLPLWNPWVGFGAPFLADASFQLAYPPAWLALVLPLAVHFKLMAIGHALLAAWGALALARRLGLGTTAAAVAGGAYALAGPFLSSMSTLHHFPGAAWLPWVLLALEGLLRKPGLASGLRLGVVGGVQLLAGSGDLCVMAALLGGARVLAHLVRRRPTGPEIAGLFRHLVLGAALALSIGAAQWMPTADRALVGLRSTQDFRTRTYWSLHPASLADLAVPRLVSELPLADPARDALFEGREPLYRCLYLGVVTLALAALALVLQARGSLPLAAGALAFLLASLGRHTPLYAWLLEAPVLGLLRYPQKYLVPVAFCVAMLAAAGAERLGRDWTAAERRRARAFALAPARRRAPPRRRGVVGASGPGSPCAGTPAARGLARGARRRGQARTLGGPPRPGRSLSLAACRARLGRVSASSRPCCCSAPRTSLRSPGGRTRSLPRRSSRAGPRRWPFSPQRRTRDASTPPARAGGAWIRAKAPRAGSRSWVAALGFQDTLRPPTGVRWGLFGQLRRRVHRAGPALGGSPDARRRGSPGHAAGASPAADRRRGARSLRRARAARGSHAARDAPLSLQLPAAGPASPRPPPARLRGGRREGGGERRRRARESFSTRRSTPEPTCSCRRGGRRGRRRPGSRAAPRESSRGASTLSTSRPSSPAPASSWSSRPSTRAGGPRSTGAGPTSCGRTASSARCACRRVVTACGSRTEPGGRDGRSRTRPPPASLAAAALAAWLAGAEDGGGFEGCPAGR